MYAHACIHDPCTCVYVCLLRACIRIHPCTSAYVCACIRVRACMPVHHLNHRNCFVSSLFLVAPFRRNHGATPQGLHLGPTPSYIDGAEPRDGAIAKIWARWNSRRLLPAHAARASFNLVCCGQSANVGLRRIVISTHDGRRTTHDA